MDTKLNEQTNQNLFKLTKWLSQRIRKTLGISVINRPLSPLSLSFSLYLFLILSLSLSLSLSRINPLNWSSLSQATNIMANNQNYANLNSVLKALSIDVILAATPLETYMGKSLPPLFLILVLIEKLKKKYLFSNHF